MQMTVINPLGLDVTTEDPTDLIPAHSVDRPDDLTDLTNSMRESGWVGAPLVVHRGSAMTGVHRIAAAIETGLDVPTVQAADLFAAAGVPFDADRSVWDLAPELEALYAQMPSEIAEAYGLDH